MPGKVYPSLVHTGTVTGPAVIDELEPDTQRKNYLPVKWDEESLEREELAQDLRASLNSQQTVYRIPVEKAHRFIALRDGFEDPGALTDQDEPTGPVLDWIPFFQELATALLPFEGNRALLLKKLREAATLSGRESQFQSLWQWETTSGKMEASDVDPFSVIALINREMKLSNKLAICQGLKEAFELSAELPAAFDAVPERKNLAIRFESKKPAPQEIEKYFNVAWELFAASVEFRSLDVFETAFNKAIEDRSLASLTVALYWVRPTTFLPMHSKMIGYLSSEETLARDLSKEVADAQGYLDAITQVKDWIPEAGLEPEDLTGLTWAAERAEVADPELAPGTQEIRQKIKYTTSRIVGDGCFLEQAQLEDILDRWRVKKNIILQGPPGTGKTWLAKRLAYALMGTDSDETVTAVQFHPSTSYEDFVQGLRPTGTTGLQLHEGPFMKAIRKAKDDEGNNDAKTHVFVIEEINRGNPAQIFGEMLTLLEADKRSADSALTTLYDPDGAEVYLPENLYIIGTMNQADRSLAMMDMALRRRFAFIRLDPNFGPRWREFLTAGEFMDATVVLAIGEAMNQVNAMIVSDPNLGANYGLGHSFVTPRRDGSKKGPKTTAQWFKQVVETELLPQLQEYWFDEPDKVEQAESVFASVTGNA
ncbi:McrB family protein [Corynebacterium phocae]|uniref:McrB family protein n=1 Tax=Corynebacterium phocae TaxID=161895 RepID=UPI001471A282|nr:AAA family ATPase [Corynebacterium phocae]